MKMLGKQTMPAFRAIVGGEAMFVYIGQVHYHEHGIVIHDCYNIHSWSQEGGWLESIKPLSTSNSMKKAGNVIMFHPQVKFIAPLDGENHELPKVSFGEELTETPLPMIVVLTNRYVVSGMYRHYERGFSVTGTTMLSKWNTNNGLGSLAVSPENPELVSARMPDIYGQHSSMFHLMSVSYPEAVKINVTL